MKWIVAISSFVALFCDFASADVGVVDSRISMTWVLYSENARVYLKECQPPQIPPLTRHCASLKDPLSLDENTFTASLPLYTDSAPKTKEGLALVLKEMADAKQAAASGNKEAEAAVARLD